MLVLGSRRLAIRPEAEGQWMFLQPNRVHPMLEEGDRLQKCRRFFGAILIAFGDQDCENAAARSVPTGPTARG